MNTGFDRGVDFLDKKKEFIKEYNTIVEAVTELDDNQRYYESKKRKLVNKAIYLLISMVQLINGSRISEAGNGFRKFLEDGFDGQVVVKIAKSESLKRKKDGEQYTTKPRYRALIFPTKWITISDDMKTELSDHLGDIKEEVLRKRVLDYLLNHHECNTHSLRYAYINYMLYTQKKEASLIAKHVGHSNLNQIVRYTQNKEAQKLFEIDI